MDDTKTIPSATGPQDLFTDDEFVTYTEATTNQRFINFLIDNLLMRYVISWGTAYLLVNGISAISVDLAYDLFSEGSELLASAVIGLVNHLIYYTICEKAFSGYTLGKLISGTRAIRDDGQELTFGNALLRSFCRLVPFETFSIWFGGGAPWHDLWTKTKVIQVRGV
jgi:uncharacterized RDD family membrane protein YckC